MEVILAFYVHRNSHNEDTDRAGVAHNHYVYVSRIESDVSVLSTQEVTLLQVLVPEVGTWRVWNLEPHVGGLSHAILKQRQNCLF